MPTRLFFANVRRFFDVRPGEAARIGLMAAFLFFLLAANNVIKIVRDALFLSRFPITHLPYVYLMAAAFAAAIITIYSRYTSRLSLSQTVIRSHAFIVSNVIIFWFLIEFYGFAWVLYAFYMWSAIVGLIAVAQFWTLANDMFDPRQGKRLFGILTAAGTLGAMTGGLAANLSARFFIGTGQLLWLIVVLFAGALSVVRFGVGENSRAARRGEAATTSEETKLDASGVLATLRGSSYLQAIAALSFISVVVSTLIDYQFKAAAKEAYQSSAALAGFFGSYYAWLSVVTLVAQVWLTGKLFMELGLSSSLLVLPVTLLAGSINFLLWPRLFTATANRFTEASLRTSVNDSGLEILYLPVSDAIKKKVKVFLDVTVERLGDGTAAFIILFCTLFLGAPEVSFLSYFSVGLILIWIVVVWVVHRGYVEALRRSLAYRELSLQEARFDYADKETVEAVLKSLTEEDESSVLFGLDLAEKLESANLVARLPRDLLRHGSPAVRRRALTLFARSPDPELLSEALKFLTSEGAQVQAEAIRTVATILKENCVALIEPFLQSPESEVRRSAIQYLLQFGDSNVRNKALSAFKDLVTVEGKDAEKSRIEAARLMGEVNEPEFSAHLSRLITEEPSPAVVREAMASAARQKISALVPEIVSRLSGRATKTAARDALVQYDEMAVKELRSALFDRRVSRDTRLNVPRTLSKIHTQSAMNALLGGLLEEDRGIRFKVILAIDEMARRFSDLTVDREIIESAIMSDALLYCRRFVIFIALFGADDKASALKESLLYLALSDSMERVKERVMWLLSLIYPGGDIRRAWAGLSAGDPIRRANAVEFLDNLLAGHFKRYVFTLFSDSRPDQRVRTALGLLGIDSMTVDSALRELLKQDDRWLKTATVWEIGIRKLGSYRDALSALVVSEDPVVRETSSIVAETISSL